MAALPLSYSTADGRSQLHSLTFILLSIPVVNQSFKKICLPIFFSTTRLLNLASFIVSWRCTISSFINYVKNTMQSHTARLVDVLLSSHYTVLIEN